jgi:hypothetical protein
MRHFLGERRMPAIGERGRPHPTGTTASTRTAIVGGGNSSFEVLADSDWRAMRYPIFSIARSQALV